MAEILTITAMGRERLVERLRTRIWGALYNLPLDATDERRAEAAAAAIMMEGEYQDLPDQGTWTKPAA